MKPTSTRNRPHRAAGVLVCAVLVGLLTSCSAGNGPTDEPSTVACSRPDSQDSQATDYLGLTESQAPAQAVGRQKLLDIIGRDGTCQAAMDLDISTRRVQVHLDDGKVTWARAG
ncbi:hypothetical protein ABH931_002562 [Streptacidiphilus sp. MAP12-33]|uniref:hypothetical protein n=1 Tax=Streptacidiphilus sp. MAP12-33 TaxID=3156266 RepID=UPI003514E0AD